MQHTRFGLALGLLASLAGSLAAQDQRNEQFYYPGSFNWQFLDRYPEGGRLFNAFDYGHAVLYEKLYTRPRDLVGELETRQYNYLTTDLLVRPPRFAVAEETIEPAYAKLAWRAKMMFDWAHLLHRQIYDIYADPRLTRAEQNRLIERVTDYYLSNRRLAFSAEPKSMALMDEQYYSQVFRHGYPKFNGLIWAYHWLQVGLYEPLILGTTTGEKKAGVQTAIARFWTMLKDAPARFPKIMPMTPVIAPLFTAAHPRAAIIFDNLHMTHDIISDILAADTVPADRKREVIYAALDEMQDTTRNLMSRDEWKNMGEMMGGIGVMGGPATGILPEPPTAAAEAPMAMAGMDHGRMAMGTGDTAAAAGPPPPAMMDMPSMDQGMDRHMTVMMGFHRRLLADSIIRERVEADTVLRRMLAEMRSMMMPPKQADSGPMMMHHMPDTTKADPHAGHHAPQVGKPRPQRPSQTPAPSAPSDSTGTHTHHPSRRD